MYHVMARDRDNKAAARGASHDPEAALDASGADGDKQLGGSAKPVAAAAAVALATETETEAETETTTTTTTTTNYPNGHKANSCSELECRGDCEADHYCSNENLDSGYAWLILVIMFLIQSSISGASRVYGVVYAEEVAIDYYDREEASWPIATASTVENLASILTPALASYLSWRKIELLSTSLFILSNLLAYFSDSLWLDILALGLIQGLALSTCTVLSLVINNDYFERYRTTAYGISMSGSTFGVLYLTPLVSWLLESYANFRLVYLALSLVFCVNLVLVLFIKPRAETLKGGARENRRKNYPRDTELEFERIKGAWAAKQQVSLEVPPNGRGGPRKLSRFESHFERKNSIAAVSYRERSRRQSVLSRQKERGNEPARPQECVFSVELAPDSKLMMMRKSQSGVELASSGCLATNQFRPQRISLNAIRSSQVAGVAEFKNSGNPLVPSSRFSFTCVAGAKFQTQQGQHHNADGNGNDNDKDYDNINTDYNDDNQNNCTRQQSLGSIADSEGCGRVRKSSSQTSSLADDSGLGPGSIKSLDPLHGATAHSKQPACAFKAQLAEALEPAGNQNTSGEGLSMGRTMQLLKLPYLHCTWIMLAIYYLVARIFVIILVDFAVDHGFSMSESTHLLNYWSIGELCGRVLLGPLIDLQYMSCKNCIVLTCSLLAGVIVCMALVESYLVYAICSTSIAALISLEYMLINVLMVEYLGKEQVTNCYPLAACISSLVLFSRPTLIGFFRDHLGSYDGLLILLASFVLIYSILFFLLEPILVRRWPKRAAN